MVHQSIKSSLSPLKENGQSFYLDSVVLHSPFVDFQDTLTVWQTLEQYHPHQIRNLGISNTSLNVLKALYNQATVKPAVVQNRFHDRTGYEVELREFCRSHGIVFQSFWTLSANPALASSPPVAKIAQSADVPTVAAYYSLVLGLEAITILDGTTSEAHMKDDLEGIEKVGLWAEGEGAESWDSALTGFKHLIGQL
jgi:diketogulonate reductase-like aldo/keto reductase